MNALRTKLLDQITNKNLGTETSLFNKASGVTIFVSIFFAVLVTENQIDYKFGDQIDFLDWVIGGLFCIEYLCRLWVAPLQEKYGSGFKGVVRYVFSPTAVIDVIAIIHH